RMSSSRAPWPAPVSGRWTASWRAPLQRPHKLTTHEEHGRREQHDVETDDDPEELLVVVRHARHEIDKDDPKTVQCVEQNGGSETHLEQPDAGVVIDVYDAVVEVRTETNKCGVGDV